MLLVERCPWVLTTLHNSPHSSLISKSAGNGNNNIAEEKRRNISSHHLLSIQFYISLSSSFYFHIIVHRRVYGARTKVKFSYNIAMFCTQSTLDGPTFIPPLFSLPLWHMIRLLLLSFLPLLFCWSLLWRIFAKFCGAIMYKICVLCEPNGAMNLQNKI